MTRKVEKVSQHANEEEGSDRDFENEFLPGLSDKDQQRCVCVCVCMHACVHGNRESCDLIRMHIRCTLYILLHTCTFYA